MFDNPVIGISLDAYDFRDDGGGASGNLIILNVFSDSFSTQVVSDTFTIPAGRGTLPDGNVVHFVVDNPSIKSAILEYGLDDGTGIDNISFTTNTPPTISGAPATQPIEARPRYSTRKPRLGCYCFTSRRAGNGYTVPRSRGDL